MAPTNWTIINLNATIIIFNVYDAEAFILDVSADKYNINNFNA